MWGTHNNQLKLNYDNAGYNGNKRNDGAKYNNDVASGVVIG
jgi:hypothetical protein